MATELGVLGLESLQTLIRAILPARASDALLGRHGHHVVDGIEPTLEPIEVGRGFVAMRLDLGRDVVLGVFHLLPPHAKAAILALAAIASARSLRSCAAGAVCIIRIHHRVFPQLAS